MLVAYETEVKTGNKKFKVFDETEKVKNLEVYNFYLYNEKAEKTPGKNEQKTHLGEKVKKKADSGYSETVKMKSDDPHYGWDLGDFFVSGYTGKVKDRRKLCFLKECWR